LFRSGAVILIAVACGLAVLRSAKVGVTRGIARPRPGPADALQRLLDGNRRFAAGMKPRADVSARRRAELAFGQEPIAAIVSCSDSRVPPELIFDQGLGDLFVCRVAGNVIDGVIAGSIEFAVSVLGTPLILILGHEECGALNAAVTAVEGGGAVSPNIDLLVDALRMPVLRVRDQPGSLLNNAIEENVRCGVQRLRFEPELMPLLRDGSVAIAGGVYSLKSGLVTLLR